MMKRRNKTREKSVLMKIDESLSVQFVYHDSRIKRMINPNLIDNEKKKKTKIHLSTRACSNVRKKKCYAKIMKNWVSTRLTEDLHTLSTTNLTETP